MPDPVETVDEVSPDDRLRAVLNAKDLTSQQALVLCLSFLTSLYNAIVCWTESYRGITFLCIIGSLISFRDVSVC